ncbi:MAG: YHS domain-containing protein [bacterium]|nr:YHS domain-containing protein [bacterium]
MVNPKKNAQLDAEHRVFVNWETYYLSDEKALVNFQKTAWKFIGKVTDPVSQMRFQPDVNSPTVVYEGRVFYFSSTENSTSFKKSPEDFATPVVGMKKM